MRHGAVSVGGTGSGGSGRAHWYNCIMAGLETKISKYWYFIILFSKLCTFCVVYLSSKFISSYRSSILLTVDIYTKTIYSRPMLKVYILRSSRNKWVEDQYKNKLFWYFLCKWTESHFCLKSLATHFEKWSRYIFAALRCGCLFNDVLHQCRASFSIPSRAQIHPIRLYPTSWWNKFPVATLKRVPCKNCSFIVTSLRPE